jgi:replicative superfamily II helicase
MKKQSNKYIAIIIFLLVNVCMTTNAQTSAEFKKLICKDWKVNFYELNGEKLKVSEEQQNAVIQYNANNTMTMSQVTVVRHGNWVYDEKEKALCDKRNSRSHLKRSRYIVPVVEILALNIGYTFEEATMLSTIISNIDDGKILEEYKIESFATSRNVNLLMHMLIELHNNYAKSVNTKFLKFLEKLIGILQSCEYKLIKLAKLT